ncbi:hypothetical protein BS618_23040 [Rhodococcus erythropolis]|nr:hypothetical protein BS618_23040 [Rhodococcus erythropolis]REK78106.1 hypothetical protein DVG80_32015 [Rhodococcus erythropolis]
MSVASAVTSEVVVTRCRSSLTRTHRTAQRAASISACPTLRISLLENRSRSDSTVTAGAKSVSAVTEGALADVDQTITVLSPAGIPLLTHSSASQAVQQTPGVFSLPNGLSP